MTELVPATEDSGQCTYESPKGRCRYQPMTDATCCIQHGGTRQAQSIKTTNLKNYQLDNIKHRLRINDIVSSSEIKSLREEIALNRYLTEERMNHVKDDYDLMLSSSAISSLLKNTESLVTSCHKIELASGELLGRTELRTFATDVIAVIAEICPPELAEEIADRIATLAVRQDED